MTLSVCVFVHLPRWAVESSSILPFTPPFFLNTPLLVRLSVSLHSLALSFFFFDHFLPEPFLRFALRQNVDDFS